MISLSLKEFALAVGAEPKWVLNAAPRLGRGGQGFAYTDADAKWLRLARVLNRDLRIPLPHAAKLARGAVSSPVSDAPERGGANEQGAAARRAARREDRNRATLVANRGEGLRLVIDLERYASTFDAALSAAKAFGSARRAGRKPRQPAHYQAALGRARRLGIDVVAVRVTMRYPLETRLGGRSRWDLERVAVGMGDLPSRAAHLVPPIEGSATGHVAELLCRLREGRVRGVVMGELAEVVRGAPALLPKPCVDVCYEPSPPNVRRLARVLRDIGARPQPVDGHGVQTSGPVDAATFSATPTLALSTRFGALTLRPGVAGVGEFCEVEREAGIMKVFGADTPVLEFPLLRKARQSAGTRADMGRLPYLDILMALPLLDARRREVARLRDAMDQHLKQ